MIHWCASRNEPASNGHWWQRVKKREVKWVSLNDIARNKRNERLFSVLEREVPLQLPYLAFQLPEAACVCLSASTTLVSQFSVDVDKQKKSA